MEKFTPCRKYVASYFALQGSYIAIKQKNAQQIESHIM